MSLGIEPTRPSLASSQRTLQYKTMLGIRSLSISVLYYLWQYAALHGHIFVSIARSGLPALTSYFPTTAARRRTRGTDMYLNHKYIHKQTYSVVDCSLHPLSTHNFREHYSIHSTSMCPHPNHLLPCVASFQYSAHTHELQYQHQDILISPKQEVITLIPELNTRNVYRRYEIVACSYCIRAHSQH